MSLHRYAKRRDQNEGEIVQALERCGFEVWPLDKPVDLACRRPSWPPGMVQLLEVKAVHRARRKDGSVIADKRQEAQQNFIATTGTPVVGTVLEALAALGAIERHENGDGV